MDAEIINANAVAEMTVLVPQDRVLGIGIVQCLNGFVLLFNEVPLRVAKDKEQLLKDLHDIVNESLQDSPLVSNTNSNQKKNSNDSKHE